MTKTTVFFLVLGCLSLPRLALTDTSKVADSADPVPVQKILSTEMSKILIFKDGVLVKKQQACFYTPSPTVLNGEAVYAFCCVRTSASPATPDCAFAKEDARMPGLDDSCALPGAKTGEKTGIQAFCTRTH